MTYLLFGWVVIQCLEECWHVMNCSLSVVLSIDEEDYPPKFFWIFYVFGSGYRIVLYKLSLLLLLRKQEFFCPEVTVRGWHDVETQLLTNKLFETKLDLLMRYC